MTTQAVTPTRIQNPTRPAAASSGSITRMRDLLKESRKPPLPVILFFLLILFPIEFNLGGLFMTGPRVLILVLIVPACLRLVTGQLGRILLTDVLFFLFAIWNIFTLFRNNPGQALSFGGSVALEMFGGYMLGRAYVKNPADFARTCIVLFSIIIITLPFALYESRTGIAPIPTIISGIPFLDSVNDFYNDLAGRRLGLERSQVVFNHPIHYGLFCSTAFSLAFVGFKGILSQWARILLAFAVLLGVFFSLSSGAILPVVVQASLIFWAWAFRFVRSRWLIFGGVCVLLYIAIDSISNRTPLVVLLDYATFSSHNAYWRMMIFEWGMKNVWANPFWGIGLNDWERPWFMRSGSMDNFWLVNAVRYGILGFLLVAIGFALVYVRVMFRNLDSHDAIWSFRRAWVITLASLFLTLCTVHVWATAQAYVFFLFGAGVWLVWYRPPSHCEVEDLDQKDTGQPRLRKLAYTRFAPVDRRLSQFR